MQHGYFDDFRAVRDQQGKIFSSPERLIDAQVAQPFPSTQVHAHAYHPAASYSSLLTQCLLQMVRPDGVEATIPPPPGQFQAALLCTAFRAGAEVASLHKLQTVHTFASVVEVWPVARYIS